MSDEPIAHDLRPEVQRFVAAMEAKLRERDEERGDDWRGETVAWRLRRIAEEIREANVALENCASEALRRELLDVANFALFAWTLLEERGEP